MNIFKTTINVYLFKIIIFILFFFAVVFTYYFFKIEDPKISALFGGLATGLIVAVIQLFLMWSDYAENEKIKQLKIKKILTHRDDELLYRNIIMQSNEQIWVLGNTALRFLQDFADKKREDKKALLDAFSRNVKVRLLLPDPKYLASQDDKDKAVTANRKILELTEEYSSLFECRYYDHAPYHNMVMADNECLVGPIFPDISSKDSPAIYTDESSIFVKPYIKYFEFEWGKATPCKTEN